MTLRDDPITILDHSLPVWDAQRVERRVLPVSITQAYDAAMRTDFLDAVRDSRVVRVLFSLRSAAERVMAYLRRRAFQEPPPPARLRLMDLPTRGSWVKLGEDRPTEFAFGVAGRFWEGETSWLEMEASTFSWFSTPGFARIACHLRFESLGPGRTQVTYATRTRTNDPKSRVEFLRYWMLVAPFVGFIMRMTLRAIERTALRMTADRSVPPVNQLTATPHTGVTTP
jgi:hypothetical protein